MKLHFDLLFNRLIFIVLSLLELFMLFLVIEEIRNGSDGLKRIFFYKASITSTGFVIITYLNVHSSSQKLPIICFRPCMEAAYKGAWEFIFENIHCKKPFTNGTKKTNALIPILCYQSVSFNLHEIMVEKILPFPLICEEWAGADGDGDPRAVILTLAHCVSVVIRNVQQQHLESYSSDLELEMKRAQGWV